MSAKEIMAAVDAGTLTKEQRSDLSALLRVVEDLDRYPPFDIADWHLSEGNDEDDDTQNAVMSIRTAWWSLDNSTHRARAGAS